MGLIKTSWNNYVLVYLEIVLSVMMFMEYLILIILFIVWTIFWSFGSVVLTRFSDNISWATFRDFLFGRSKCPNCNNILKAKNLIPFFSYILQKWKCEYCSQKISVMYPLLELLSGLFFVLTYFLWIQFWHLGTMEILFRLVVNRWFLLLIFWDFMHYELHFVVRIFLLFVGLFSQFFGFMGSYKWAFFGSLIFWWFFYLIYLASNRYVKLKYDKSGWWFGMWDVFLAFLVWTLVPFVFVYNGLFINFSDIFVFIFLFVMSSSVIGLIYGAISFMMKKSTKKEFMTFRIPFVPSMIFAFWILLFFWKTFYTLLFF